MKILFLHGAIKNAGDFLIAHRSKELIRYLIPNIEIVSAWEGTSREIVQELLKDVDGIVFGGGPFFTASIYPHDIPLVSNLEDINIPMLNIGGGWFGQDAQSKTIHNYFIDKTSLDLLKKIEKSSQALSCRDWYTTNMLRLKGYNANMHGCPAWYDIGVVNQSKLRRGGSIKKICVSDPANIRNSSAAKVLIYCLKKKFPAAEIQYVFHRGTWGERDGELGKKRRRGIENVLIENAIKWIDISGGYEGFKVYDSCDLHIGFRVHAHIYNLSRRNRSILIEEDGRGAGVNQALGLTGICAYDERRQYRNTLLRRVENTFLPNLNSYLQEDIMLQLAQMEANEGLEYECAFKRMQFFFEKICRHIRKIESWDKK